MTDEHHHHEDDLDDPFDFPDWLMPQDLDQDPPMSDYLALAEWYWAHKLDSETRELARDVADDRRRVLIEEHGLDLADEATITALFYGWHHAQKSTMNFLPFDCDDIQQAHMLVHVVRNFQWNSILLLLTLEPNTPDPLEIDLT